MVLGRSASRLGLGAWAFGRTGWGVQHDRDSVAAIIRAVELDITWIDTAAVYGDGHSERLIGRTLSALPESARPLVFTKGGMLVDRSTNAAFRDLSPASLRRQSQASLGRLGVERIDLYQLHWPVDDPKVVEQAWETLGELQREGTIRWAGVSNFSVELLDRCFRIRPIDAMQVPLSLLNRHAGHDLLPWAAEHGVRVLGYSPLESGLLSGRFSLERLESLPHSDWRRARRQFQQPSVDSTLALLERLAPIADGLGASLAELAIAWTLAWPAVDGVIVGARDAGQVDGWVGASQLTLDATALSEIETALAETQAGDGPLAPPRTKALPCTNSISSSASSRVGRRQTTMQATASIDACTPTNVCSDGHDYTPTVPVQSPPYPPLKLAHRVGSLADAAEPFEYYNQLGRETRDGILAALPADWTFSGKRILDFGCGAGRTLRQFTDEATEAELWGCDIDEESIDWMTAHMSPPFHAFVNGSEPPLDQPNSSFDLIWAISVFTHLASSWSRWLVELHRLLRPDALLLVTFMGRGMTQEIAGETWQEGNFGMNVIKFGQSWDLGGPMVIHSPWWVEEHWGRAFEILSLAPDGFASKPWLDHGWVLMRKRDIAIDADELERIAPGDEREARALAHNVKQLHNECLELRAALSYFDGKVEEQGRQLAAQTADLDREREAAEEARQETQRAYQEIEALHQETTSLQREIHSAQQQATAARERSLNSAKRLLEVEEVLAQSKARIFALEEALDTLTPQLERADHIMAAMKASVSWRITAPLRALKRRR